MSIEDCDEALEHEIPWGWLQPVCGRDVCASVLIEIPDSDCHIESREEIVRVQRPRLEHAAVTVKSRQFERVRTECVNRHYDFRKPVAIDVSEQRPQIRNRVGDRIRPCPGERGSVRIKDKKSGTI